MAVKFILKFFTKSDPAAPIREARLEGVGRMKPVASGVQDSSLRGAPIEGETRREYLVPVKSRSLNVRAELARVSVGRMFLHVACALKDGRVQWHWQGIKRELAQPSRMGRAD